MQHNIMLFNCLPNNKTATSHSIICLKFCDSGNVRNHVELSCFDVWTLAQGYVWIYLPGKRWWRSQAIWNSQKFPTGYLVGIAGIISWSGESPRKPPVWYTCLLFQCQNPTQNPARLLRHVSCVGASALEGSCGGTCLGKTKGKVARLLRNRCAQSSELPFTTGRSCRNGLTKDGRVKKRQKSMLQGVMSAALNIAFSVWWED